MDWREFLEKDALDGKGANDKIKDPKWVDDPPIDDAYGKDVKIKPKKFLNVAHDAKLYRTDSKGDETESSKKITRKQTNSGKLTGLDDAHSNEVFRGRPNPRGDGGHRGDELGTVEHYKRKLRHGGMVGKPNFSLSSGKYDEDNKISGHEGRHRARAAMEEGHEEIPTKLVAYSGASADEYGVGLKNRGRKNLKGLKYEDKKPKTDRSEDTRHPMLGRKKSWESWLEKTEPTGLTARQKKLAKEIADGDNEDHKQQFTPTLDPKEASWETWLEKNDPCWEGYEQYGMKDKDGKKVPNCVKKADESKPLNKPMRDDGNKKFKVFVRDPSTGNIVTVRFGDPNMEIKRDNPERRSSFRARHKCSEQKDITSAAYWSCKMWEKTSSVSDNLNKSNWEIWLEKNNATETSHKDGEKKHEWDGKFSSSNTKDEVKDEKAQSEEEPLEELTDGKLEEVEKLKSWELFLEKYDKDPNPEETDPEKIMQNAEVVGRKDNPMIKDIYRSWLEKMQGAGDARYGNQHLTGMEQKPVDDDESIDLSAESDKNNEKQEKTEKNDSKDNKPYKALS